MRFPRLTTAVASAAFAMFALAGLSHNAQGVVIQNPSFETDVATNDPATASAQNNENAALYPAAPPSWSTDNLSNFPGGVSGVYNPDGAVYQDAGDGSATGGVPKGGTGKLIYFNTFFQPGATQTIYQDLAETLQPATQYTLTIGVGQRFNRGPLGYSIGLSTLNRGTNNPLQSTGDPAGGGLVAGEFTDKVVTFTTGAAGSSSDFGQPLRVLISANFLGTENGVQSTDFDNVRLTATAVPEPSVIGGIAMGMGSLLLRRRRA